MSNSIFGHKIDVAKVPFEAKIDTVLNVKKRKEKILYSTQTNNNKINLAYIDTDLISTTTNLFLSDRGTKLAGNRVIETDPVQFTGAAYSTKVDTFLLTDVFTDNTPTQDEIPLFFVHLLNRSNYNPDDSTHLLTKVEVLDKELKPVVDLTEVLIQDTTRKDLGYGAVFNNLENAYNEVTGTHNVYYIKYTVRRGSAFSTHTELLNNTPVYREAEPDDVDGFGNLIDTRRTYVITETSSGFDIEISRSAKHAIAELVIARIKASKPSSPGPEENWFLTISNGKFFTSVAGKGVLKYEIAEFSSQIFNPFFPYKTIDKDEPVRLTNTLYKLSKTNITTDTSEGFHVVAEIVDSDGTVTEAFTTDPDRVGDTWLPSVTLTDGIRSVDALNGFVELKEKPPASLRVLFTYSYEEKNYEFIDIDFNPVFNTQVLDEFVVLYIRPQGGASLSETLEYLRVDKEDNIIFSSQADSLGSGALYDAVNAGLTYTQFLQDFTIEGDTTEVDNEALLVIAEAYTGEATSHEEAEIIDLRIRGGGIREATRQQILEDNFESIWNWDIGSWDGYPYPGSSSFYVEVPCELLTTNNGALTRKQIKSIVDEHSALGVYPIVKVYGFDPVISGVSITQSGVVNLDWTFHGPDVSYNVYRSTAVSGPFEKENDSEITETSYTVSGLDSNTKYWFFVTGIDSLGNECFDTDHRFVLGLETW